MVAFRAIAELLEEVGLRFSNYDSLDREDRGYVDSVFEDRIFPVLTPLAVDPAASLPLHQRSLTQPCRGRGGARSRRDQRIARVKVPPLLPRFVVMPDGERFVPVEQVIASHLDRLFPGMRVDRPVPVPRDAQRGSGARGGGGRGSAQRGPGVPAPPPPVTPGGAARDRRHDVRGGPAPAHARARALGGGRLPVDGPLDLSGLWGIYEVNRPDLKERLPAPVIPPALAKSPERRRRGRHLQGHRWRRRPRPPPL